MKQGKMTRNAKAFKHAADQLGIVRAEEKGPDVIFTLRGGRQFRLTPGERRALGVVVQVQGLHS